MKSRPFLIKNLAYIPHIRQHHLTSLYSSTEIGQKNLISTEAMDKILTLNTNTFSKLKLNKYIFGEVIFEAIEATQRRPKGQKLGILV